MGREGGLCTKVALAVACILMAAECNVSACPRKSEVAVEVTIQSGAAKANDLGNVVLTYAFKNRTGRAIRFVKDEMIAYINYQWSPIDEPPDRYSGGTGQWIIERFGGANSGNDMLLESKGRVSGQMDLAKIIGSQFVGGRSFSVWVELCCIGSNEEGMCCWKSNVAKYKMSES